ncbi:MAG: hypothetical protein LBR10_13905 [Prevotellaceae bacterium]|nr:hypothetical protein [Prevotellaceae bacterium]
MQLGLKSSRFHIEDTHLTDLERIEKLFSIVMVASAWAYAVGVYINDHIKPITIKTLGRRAKSFFKYGLECIANILLNICNSKNLNVFKFLSCT